MKSAALAQALDLADLEVAIILQCNRVVFVIFVEMPLFTGQITGLVGDSDYALLQKELLHNPKKGDVIPNSGGLRKIRMRLPGRGKSGGARAIYLHLEERAIIVFFYVYTKAKSENLSAEQLQRLRLAAAIIKAEFKL
jgi:hypothetical protein